LAVRLGAFGAHGRTGVVGAVGRTRIYVKDLALPSCFRRDRDDARPTTPEDDDDDDDSRAVMYTGHGSDRGCEWMAEPIAATFDVALAAAFMDPTHRALHDLVRAHPVHPDDFAFGAFAAWHTGRPALVLGDALVGRLVAKLRNVSSFAFSAVAVPPAEPRHSQQPQQQRHVEAEAAAAPRPPGNVTSSALASRLRAAARRRHVSRPLPPAKMISRGASALSSSSSSSSSSQPPPRRRRRRRRRRALLAGADDDHTGEAVFVDAAAQRRRRLGMAGGPNWHFHRGWACAWIEHYFGGGPSARRCANPSLDQILAGDVFGEPARWEPALL